MTLFLQQNLGTAWGQVQATPRVVAFTTWNVSDSLITWNVASTMTTWNVADSFKTTDS